MSIHKRASKAELERIGELIDGMSYSSKIFHLLKDKLTVLGYWRNRPRGKPSAKNFGSKSANLSEGLKYEAIEG